MKALALVAALALSGCASLDAISGCGMLMPPAALDHEPTVPVLPLDLPAAQVRDYCGRRVTRDPRIPVLEACSVRATGGNWVLVLPIDAPEDRRVCLRKHENGHINGGDAQHTGWHQG